MNGEKLAGSRFQRLLIRCQSQHSNQQYIVLYLYSFPGRGSNCGDPVTIVGPHGSRETIFDGVFLEERTRLGRAPIDGWQLRSHSSLLQRRYLLLQKSLGDCMINLSDVVSNKRINDIYQLEHTKKGRIKVELQWLTTGQN
jgi:hypothetical protein